MIQVMRVGQVTSQPASPHAEPTARRPAPPRRADTAGEPWCEPNPFYGPALLGPALARLDPAGHVRIVEAHDAAGALIGRLPVVPGDRHGRFPIAHSANWLHRHCFFGAPLLRTGHEGDAWAGLLASLDAADWSGAFLHLRTVDPDGPAIAALVALCTAQRRRCEQVDLSQRAMLRSPLDAAQYWAVRVRAKKRKELRRLQSRLAELGEVRRRVLQPGDDLVAWLDAFLALEARGWKGAQGTALGARAEDAAFLREACAGARAADQLDILRIDCANRPIAMLINFVGPAGGFSFKIAIDPDFARFSPGVLIEQDNLARVLDDRVAPWMDSCAAPDHPMIDSLWGERRAIAQYRIALRKPGLAGFARSLSLPAISLAEQLHALIKPGDRR